MSDSEEEEETKVVCNKEKIHLKTKTEDSNYRAYNDQNDEQRGE